MVVNPRKLGVAAVLALAATLTACGTDDGTASDTASTTPSEAPSEGASSSPAASDPSTEPSTEPSSPSGTASAPAAPASSAAAQQQAVPLYYVGDTPTGQRLYREFQTAVTASPVAEALDLLAATDPLDPDYVSLVPPGTVAGAEVDDDAKVIRVELPASSSWTQAGSLTPKQARLAAQSVIYTAQGAAQQRYPVEVVTEGSTTPTTLFGIPTDGGLKQAPPLRILSLVNVTNPLEGTQVSGSFTADGVASSFEATVPWELRDPAGKVVRRGSAMAEGWMGRLYPWKVTVKLKGLAPGDYTFVAMTDDPSGGAEGPGAYEDTRHVVVE